MTTPRKTLANRVNKVAISREARQRWLEAIALGASKSRAAELAGVARQRFDERLKMDPIFAAQYEEAVERWADAVEDMLIERSQNGMEEVVLNADGRVIRKTVKHHPQDLHMLAKAARPEKYREGTQVGIAIGNTEPIVVRHERGLTLADVAAFASELDSKQAEGGVAQIGRPVPALRQLPPGPDSNGSES